MLIVFTWDLNREGYNTKDLIEDGREFHIACSLGKMRFKMIEFCKLCRVNSCEDRAIIIVILATLFVYNIARMLPIHSCWMSKPLHVHEQFAWAYSSVTHACMGVLCADSAVLFRVSIPFHSVLFRILLTTKEYTKLWSQSPPRPPCWDRWSNLL